MVFNDAGHGIHRLKSQQLVVCGFQIGLVQLSQQLLIRED